jgi:hypothetical protein
LKVKLLKIFIFIALSYQALLFFLKDKYSVLMELVSPLSVKPLKKSQVRENCQKKDKSSFENPKKDDQYHNLTVIDVTMFVSNR